ncbi:MAG: NAD(P)H-dependent glycerol-3-phosphate dehydrogenase [Pseudomonadota bacterium]
MNDPRFDVIGAGAWGTALAIMLAKDGSTVRLVARSPEKAARLQADRINTEFLPGSPFPESLHAHSLTQYCEKGTVGKGSDAPILVLAQPAQATRKALKTLASQLVEGQTIVLTAKGLDRDSHALLSNIVQAEAPQATCAVLSGPSFAHDVGKGLPTAVTLAANTLETADHLCELLRGQTFRPYASDDLIGVQLGGALKNVLAIAAGIVEGRALGESAKAALISRGFAEMSRLAITLGAKPETLNGLSGLGDLVLTCSTAGSRNFRFGVELAKGRTATGLLADGQPLAEGAKTAAAALALSTKHNVDMPINSTVASIIEDGLSVDDAIIALLSRPLKRE